MHDYLMWDRITCWCWKVLLLPSHHSPSQTWLLQLNCNVWKPKDVQSQAYFRGKKSSSSPRKLTDGLGGKFTPIAIHRIISVFSTFFSHISGNFATGILFSSRSKIKKKSSHLASCWGPFLISCTKSRKTCIFTKVTGHSKNQNAAHFLNNNLR